MPRLPEELAYLNRELRRVLRRKDVLGIVLEANGGGFLDGNCGTLAMALQRTLFPAGVLAGTFFQPSRGGELLDHVVLRVGPDWYADGDGIQSGADLAAKMAKTYRRQGVAVRDISVDDLRQAAESDMGFDECRPDLVKRLAAKLAQHFKGSYRTANPAPALAGKARMRCAVKKNNPPLMPGHFDWYKGWLIAVDDDLDGDGDRAQIQILQREGGRKIEVGRIALSKSNTVPGSWMVYESSVQPAYAGRGLGQALYLLALRLLGPVHPDWEQAVSPSAMRVWHTLKKRGLIAGQAFPGFRHAKIRLDTDFDDDDHVQVTAPAYFIDTVFPRHGWRGVLDQVYTLKDPSSVPLVKAR